MSMLDISKKLDRMNRKVNPVKVREEMKDCCKDGSCGNHGKKLGEAAKITKSDLKQLIRECIREELDTTKPAEKTLVTSLDSAIKYGSNVLLHTQAGRGTFANCAAWANTQNVHLAYINCASADAVAELNRIAEEAIPKTVLYLDQYNRARSMTRARLLSAVLEKDCGQIFSIAINCSNVDNAPINPAEKYKFDIECYLD